MAGLGAGSVLFLPSCEALKSLATAAPDEGVGFQFVGLVKVLTKYQSSPRQRTIAEEKSRRAFVDRGMRPAFADAKKKAQQRHRKQEAVARRQNAGDPAKQQQAVARVQVEGSRELATIEDSYHKGALHITDKNTRVNSPQRSRVRCSPTCRPGRPILTASAAYVAPYVAVSVPAERAVAGAAASVMFWDNRTHELAKNEVYVINREPALGTAGAIRRHPCRIRRTLTGLSDASTSGRVPVRPLSRPRVSSGPRAGRGAPSRGPARVEFLRGRSSSRP